MKGRLLGALLLLACGLPTKTEPGSCAKDDHCPSGWKCGTDQRDPTTFYRCYCASDGCRDAGVGADSVTDGGPTSDGSGKCQRNTDCPSDHPLCATTGACVECFNPGQCTNPAKSFCVATVCTGCQGAGTAACKAPTGTCDATSGRCVECTTDAQCTADPNRPLCVANACVSCGKADPKACAKTDATKPACGPAGACVECNESPDCTQPAKSICVSNKCEPCTTDTQCAARNGPNPGVCLTHRGGFCLTDDATIYVQNSATCSSVPTAGTAAMPFCKPQDALAKVTNAFKNIVIRGPAAVAGLTWSNPMVDQLNIIGQQSATIAGGPESGIQVLAGGNLFVRGLKISPSAEVGIVAENGSTLTLEHVDVENNLKGGILLDGAAFDIRDTRVANNGPGQVGPTTWGGIFVKSAPPSSMPGRLVRVSLEQNKASGLTCSAPIEGMGVFAAGNAAVDIATTCAITACTPAGPTCGVQP
jgi:hypothetical protein